MARSGGNSSGSGQRTVNYTPNALNQYSSITTPGSFDVLVRSTNAVGVAVNGTPVSVASQGTFRRAEATVTNTDGAWAALTITSPVGQNSITGRRWLPPATFTPVHDSDGNLLDDGRWINTWDAENRLITQTTSTLAAEAGVPRCKVENTYDWQSRRIRKKVSSSADGTTWTVVSDERFVYERWNQLAVFVTSGNTLTVKESNLWGLDLSGTLQGAGGVGGLLAVSAISDPQSPILYPSYDGNGNIIAWTDSNGATKQRIDYDPFGNVVTREGDSGFVAPAWGFSTKYQDKETGLLYYGFRFYDSVTGRWPSRDPIGEDGGLNLYGFVRNNGGNRWDYLGLTTWTTDFGILENDAGFWSVLNHAINTWENINPFGVFGAGQGRDYFTDIKYLGLGPSVTSGGADGNLKDQHPKLFTKLCAMNEGDSVSVNHDVNNWFSDQRPWTIGHINLRVSGSLTKICPRGKKMWKFEGRATAYPDKFDFNQMHRAAVTTKRDIGIGILDFLQRNSSRWFYIKPQGSASFKDVGLCK